MLVNRTIRRLEEMMNGDFEEKEYDETKLSRLETKWKRFLNASVLSKEALAQERETLKSLISDISHQTKTPMTNIKLYTSLLDECLRGEDNREQKEKSIRLVEELVHQTEKLEFLIHALTKMSRLEGNIVEVKPKQQSVYPLLVAVREAMNLLYLLGNTEKRAEAEQLAIAITGASGLAPLVAVTTFFILTVWALAESIEDVSILLRGGKVSFVKQRDDWKVSLSGLAGEGIAVLGKAEDSGKEGRGLDYQAYLKLLLLLCSRAQKEYRMMDMIQKNIRIVQTDFLVRKCACRLEAEVKGRGVLIPVKKRTVKAY